MLNPIWLLSIAILWFLRSLHGIICKLQKKKKKKKRRTKYFKRKDSKVL